MVHRRVRGGQYKINYAKKQPPVELGEELEVNITDVCPSGDGISNSRLQNYCAKSQAKRPRKNKVNTSRRKNGNRRNNQITANFLL